MKLDRLTIFIFIVFCLHISLKSQDDSIYNPSNIDSTYFMQDSLVPLSDSVFYEEEMDSLEYTEPYFREGFKSDYQSEEFVYEKAQLKELNPFLKLLQKIVRWLFGDKDSEFNLSGWVVWVFRFLVVMIVLLSVYVIIKTLLGEDAFGIFRKNNPYIRTGDHVAENIHDTNFLELIRIAIARGDFRSAIRYHYLRTLQSLHKSRKIEIHPDKTDADYGYEIKNTELQKQFHYLSYLYNYAWYGAFEINQEEFEQVSALFNRINEDF
ncbi:MAG: hypothetical protein IPM42_11725 [Saprospiraceae bacterium]|nr:hypothetical protein [Saprospiraceae bacterium]